MASVRVWVGTTDGLYAFTSDARRLRWRRQGPYLRGLSVSHCAWDARTRTLYAATLTDGVYASRTGGRTWTALNDGLSIRRVWTVAVNPRDPDQLWAGTHFSYLFWSADRGRTWRVHPGYLEAPGKEGRYGDWGYGTIGNSLHGIHLDPRDPRRMLVVSSTNHGAVRSLDGGQSWEYARTGVYESCPVAGTADLRRPMSADERARAVEQHLAEVHACTHRIDVCAANPRVLYRQQHCGVYRSEDFGATWQDISTGLPDRHGFPVAAHPADPGTAFTVPAYQGTGCARHNSCIRGPLDVYRTRTGGRTWERLSDGLPRRVHCVVLRHALDADTLRPVGIYLGTTSGEVYGSPDEGDRWVILGRGLPRVQGITAVVG
ncbi:MAG: hypothetical protein QN173_03845 [Armatimonadota bacterium]|nr:hypothetical protein [Armatimonadota bacterium]MDR7402494.1 hypothetical protein [Armatimonadota bacterium]MDR7436117.1 hypothetical protein [Armatimonadota bacterium]MDR7471996.1 hypothetical protein [Armatimonadota bacterium]MDR7506720.1 hypothetical protein [Armatimonadota bacterium]